MMRRLAMILAAAVTLGAAPPPADPRPAILAVVARMEAAWNRGDFPGYMAGFKRPDVVFVSGGRIQDGWQGTLDHYVRDYGGSADARGRLHFYAMTVDPLGPDVAMLVGRYRLVRGARTTEGVNTRLFRRVRGDWLVTVNHVSAYDVIPSAPAARPDRPAS